MRDLLINRDWLSFSVLLAMPEEEIASGAYLRCPDGYTMLELSGTNIYRRRVEVRNVFGDKVLTLLLAPYSKVIDPRSMFVEVANRWLYADSLEWVFPLLEQIHLFSFQSLSRVDICGDFCPSVSQWEVIRRLTENSAYVTGKREGSIFCDYVIPEGGGHTDRVPKCISWGAKNSNIRWKLYNKTKELTEEYKNKDGKVCIWWDKTYIRDQWQSAGLDIKNVWRLEFSILGAAKYSWRDGKLSWDTVLSWKSCVDLFSDMVSTRFVVRENQGHKSRKWDTVMDFLPVTDGDHHRLRQRLVGKDQHYTDHAATLRGAIKQLERPEVLCYPAMRSVWLDVVRDVVRVGHLESFFLRQYGMSVDNYLLNIQKTYNYE